MSANLQYKAVACTKLHNQYIFRMSRTTSNIEDMACPKMASEAFFKHLIKFLERGFMPPDFLPAVCLCMSYAGLWPHHSINSLKTEKQKVKTTLLLIRYTYVPQFQRYCQCLTLHLFRFHNFHWTHKLTN